MNNDDSQYLLSNYKKNNDNQYKLSNYKKKYEKNTNNKDQLELLKKHHPIIYKLAEQLKDYPILEKLGNVAGHFNKAVEGTGLPSLAKGFYGTGINMGRGIANLAPGVNIPEQHYSDINVNPYIGQGMETVGSLGMGLPAYRAYQGAKGAIEAIPHAAKIPAILKNLLAGTTVGAALSPDDRGLGAALGAGAEFVPSAVTGVKNWYQARNPMRAEKDLYKSMLEHEMQKTDLESLKNLSSHQFGKNNPESLLLSAADKEAKLKEMQAYKTRHLPEEKMLPGQQLVPEAEHEIQSTNEALKHILGEGEPHSQDLSKRIIDAVEGRLTTEPHPKTGLPREVRKGGLREEIGKKYDALEEGLPNIKIPGSADMQAVEKELNKLTSNKSNLTEEQKESFRNALAATHPSNKTKEINGKEFFRAYRSLRKMEGSQRSKAFGLSPKEHDEWISRANDTKKTYEDMEKIIDQHFPKDTIKRLHEINHEYANKVAPLNENPTYQQMLKHGRVSGNMIEALSGTTSGNKILNNMIHNDPELSRLILGHTFAEHPEKLIKPNKSIESYIKAHPEISQLTQHQKAAMNQLESAKKQAEMYKQIENIPKLTKEIREQEAMAKKLKHESEVAGLTKAEVAKKKMAYENAQTKAKALRNKLIGASLFTTSVGYGYKKLKE